MSDEITPREEIQRKVEQIKFEEMTKKLAKATEEYTEFVANQKRIKAVEETTQMYEMIDQTASDGSLEKAGSAFEVLSGKFSAFGILMEILAPVIDVINGLLNVFIGTLMEKLKPAFDVLFEALSSEGVQDAITFIADIFANILTPVIQGISTFLNWILGGVEPPTAVDQGMALGTVIGAIVGAALGAFIGLPWLGAIIGGWIGGMIGSVVPTWVLDVGGGDPGQFDEPQFAAEGGVVTDATLTWIGEGGEPEIVMNQTQFNEMSENSGGNVEELTQIRDVLLTQNKVLSTKQGIQRRKFG